MSNLFNDKKQIETLEELCVELLSEVQLIMNLWDHQDIRGAVIMLHKIQASVEDFAANKLPEMSDERMLELKKEAYKKVGYVYEE